MPARDYHGFLARNPVFTLNDAARFLSERPLATPNGRKRLLSYHKARGHIVAVRSGLYAAVPTGFTASSFVPDSFLIAARLTPDAVLAYHTALEFHGVAQSLWQERIVVASNPLSRPVRFQGIAYRTVAPPIPLLENRVTEMEVRTTERAGAVVRVTSLERTIVDVLDRPRLGGGWEEVWRSYESVPYLDLEAVVRYALALGNATTIAQVGYFLTSKQAEWMVEEQHLAPLRARRPMQPQYAQRGRHEPARLVKEWNILAPVSALVRSWEDTHEPFA